MRRLPPAAGEMTVRVDDVMQTGYPLLQPDMPMRRAVSLLLEAEAAAAPVVDDAGGLVGILTQKDCFRPALHASYYQEWKDSVGDHMTRQVRTVDASEDLVAAAEAFAAGPHRVLPVLQDGRLAGMLGRSEVLAALVRLG